MSGRHPAADVPPLRVALVAACPFPARRGTPVRIERMAEALVERGHDVTVFTYPLADGAVRGDVDVQRSVAPPTYRRMAAGPSIQKLLVVDPLLAITMYGGLREKPFDLVHAHHAEGLLVARAARKRPTPLVYDAHTSLESELPAYVPRPARGVLGRLGRGFDRTLPRLADHTITVTPALRDRLVRLGQPPERVTVVENGVDDAFLRSAAETPREGIVFAGGLGPYQGIELLLDAMAEVREHDPRAQLTVAVQDPALWSRYEAQCARLGLSNAVRLVQTSLHELPDVIASHAVAVNPRTHADGMPVKVLNYMATRTPIVSFAGSAHGLEDHRSALLAPDGDTSALSTAVIELLENPALAARIGSEAHALARSRTWSRVGEALEVLYLRLLGAPVGRAPGT